MCWYAALLSRFDTILEFPYPDAGDIAAILALYARHLNEKDRVALATRLEGLSPRAIIDVCKRAERMQARELIQSASTDVSLPNLEKYMHAVHTKTEVG